MRCGYYGSSRIKCKINNRKNTNLRYKYPYKIKAPSKDSNFVYYIDVFPYTNFLLTKKFQ